MASVSSMFRTSVRNFVTTARRTAESLADMERPAMHGINVSHAQGIAEKGFVSGTHNIFRSLKDDSHRLRF